jgi:hypothetical protein
MIALAADCLLFEFTTGEQVPFSAEMVSVEVSGETGQWLDPDLVRDTTNAVFHYFKHELGRQSVTVGEFSEAMEKALKGFQFGHRPAVRPGGAPGVIESDLRWLARESGEAGELVFFPRLRAVLREQLREQPRMLRFYGLRGCVKQLARTRRWTSRCRDLEDQIVAYLRECLSAETGRVDFALLVE